MKVALLVIGLTIIIVGFELKSIWEYNWVLCFFGGLIFGMGLFLDK